MAQPRILILGAPGAGKGTQSAKITDEFAVDHITTGDALRNNKEMDISELDTEYDTPGEYMDRGELVPDEVVNAIVDEALSQADGFVLDGYPRNVEQAEELEGMTDLNVVLSLEVGEEELVHRLTGRRMDPETGDIYHVEYNPPEDPDVEARLEQRDDDTEETVWGATVGLPREHRTRYRVLRGRRRARASRRRAGTRRGLGGREGDDRRHGVKD